MAKLTDLPVVTSLDPADLIYAIDVSTDTSVGITKANLGGSVTIPVVQSARVEGDGTLDWSTEAGWVVVRTGEGIYTVTFPTAAASAEEQAVGGSVVRALATITKANHTINLYDVTTTGCTAYVTYNNPTVQVNTDQPFNIIRRLPDVTVNL